MAGKMHACRFNLTMCQNLCFIFSSPSFIYVTDVQEKKKQSESKCVITVAPLESGDFAFALCSSFTLVIT